MRAGRIEPIWLVIAVLTVALVVSGIVIGITVHDLQTPTPYVVSG